MTAADTISKFLQRGTGMNPDIGLIRANHLLDDLNRAGYAIVPKEPTNEAPARDRATLAGGSVTCL